MGPAATTLINVTTGTVLAQRADVARAVLTRVVGLLGRRAFSDGEAMIFPRCSSIHTCGMAFPIDAIFLRGDLAVKLVERLGSWRMVWAGGADTVIELPAGAIARTATQIGQRFQWFSRG